MVRDQFVNKEDILRYDTLMIRHIIGDLEYLRNYYNSSCVIYSDSDAILKDINVCQNMCGSVLEDLESASHGLNTIYQHEHDDH